MEDQCVDTYSHKKIQDKMKGNISLLSFPGEVYSGGEKSEAFEAKNFGFCMTKKRLCDDLIFTGQRTPRF